MRKKIVKVIFAAALLSIGLVFLGPNLQCKLEVENQMLVSKKKISEEYSRKLLGRRLTNPQDSIQIIVYISTLFCSSCNETLLIDVDSKLATFKSMVKIVANGYDNRGKVILSNNLKEKYEFISCSDLYFEIKYPVVILIDKRGVILSSNVYVKENPEIMLTYLDSLSSIVERINRVKNNL